MTTHHHQRRRPSIGDKVSGAMLRLKGSLTRRPGVKVYSPQRIFLNDAYSCSREQESWSSYFVITI